MIATRPIPAYHRRPATTKPLSTSATVRPGDKISRKTNWQLDKQDWRGDILLLDSAPRSVPTKKNGVTIIDHLGGGGSLDRKAIFAEGGVSGGREVDLEGLLESGKGKREKRATTATTLGYDFIADPIITALPELPTSRVAPCATRKILHKDTGLDGDKTPLAHTPRTPALIPVENAEVADEEDEDDEWERVSSMSGVEGSLAMSESDVDDLGSVILLGEMEIEDEPGKVEAAKAVGSGAKISYAAALRRKGT